MMPALSARQTLYTSIFLFSFASVSGRCSFIRPPCKQRRLFHGSCHDQSKRDKNRKANANANTNCLSSVQSEGGEPDLFEYFDPLLSPHAYPKGIVKEAGIAKEIDNANKEVDGNGKDDIPPFDPLGWSLAADSTPPYTIDNNKKFFGKKLKVIGLDVEPENRLANVDPGSLPNVSGGSSSPSQRLPVDPFSTFDPTLSPHFYTNGAVPNIIVGDDAEVSAYDDGDVQTTTIGVLIMDHGSRNDASNLRLQEIGQLYQQKANAATSTSDNARSRRQTDCMIVVEVAHMEIASPSIADGLKALVDRGVDEIVCHPYFLSPGRHVVEDIPLLVAEAVKSLSITMPVTISKPLGSATDTMIGAIHSLVQETSLTLSNKNQSARI